MTGHTAWGLTPDRDPALWFPLADTWGPADDARADIAKDICRGCPALADCERWATTVDDRYALLAAKTPSERAVGRPARSPVRHRPRWTEQDVTTVRDLARVGYSDTRIAYRLGRGPRTVRAIRQAYEIEPGWVPRRTRQETHA